MLSWNASRRMPARLIGCAVGMLAIAAPVASHAQAYGCTVPAQIPVPRADGPTSDQPQRLLPIGGYTLAISWTPQYCRSNARDESAQFQCGTRNAFGFTLHGLWPDGTGKTWPQYCKAADILPAAVIKDNLCTTPSAQLLQHEWAKHGTCMSASPAAYFDKSKRLYAGLRYPDMNLLSRRKLTAGQFASAMARANPGIAANMMRITTTRQGWLDEVWLCLDKGLRYAKCSADQGGVRAGAPIKIWRGRR